MKTAEELIKQTCIELYNKKGSSAVYNYCNLLMDNNRLNRVQVNYAFCEQCYADTPHLKFECLICGQ